MSFILLLLSRPAVAAEAGKGTVDFSRDVKPLLSNTCFKCHGPDPAVRKGGTDGLRLDTAEGAAADLGGYAAVVPGQPEKSELVARITSTDPDSVMPPASTGKKLTARDIELLTTWVREGAQYAGHWSYAKPMRPVPPAVDDGAWPRNEIDPFILHRLQREGLKPSPEADRYALARRVSLDLTGLPPTIEETDAFVSDPDPRAYEKLVERLLEKPAYGEHWGHMWLDLARYADSAGYADDPPRTIWLYRDYVIRSLNANKPFDQFTVEQLAGDLLPSPTDEQLIATALHRNTLTNNEGGTNDEEFRNVAVVDRVNTTMAVWMGTTVACAQCHDHKYDPITQQDFFRLFAFFNNTADADRTDESPLLPIYSDEQQRRRTAWQGQLAALEQTLRTPPEELQAALRAAQERWERAFPLDLKWQPLAPAAVKAESGAAVTLAGDGSVHVAPGAVNDTYTVEITLPATLDTAADGTGSLHATLHALRLEVLPDDTLAAKGPGHANGNFVLTGVNAVLTPPENQIPVARYVRIELPGSGKILSLAEVQAFHGGENVAPGGEASQSSTAFDGAAKRAIDGNSNGRYFEANSTTHTAASENPWWEVDLKQVQPIDRIVVFNRTDPTTEDRLSNFRLLLLDALREPVWQQTVAVAPKPSREFSTHGARPLELTVAVADYSQAGFDPQQVLKNPDPKQKGWAIGGATGVPHMLTLVAGSDTSGSDTAGSGTSGSGTSGSGVELKAGSKLTVTLAHASQLANHTLGHFRLSLTGDARAAELARTPIPVVEALRLPAGQRAAEQAELITRHYLSLAPELEPARRQAAELTKQLAELKPATVPIQRELPGDQRRKTQIQHRGNFLDLGAEVSEGTPAAFPPLPQDAPRNRLTLAHWLIDENNPLTPRVIANRYWEQLFGIGIVSTSEEFGAQGEMPFHPELLDWLATELVRGQWDLKAFLRRLVTSATYRQSSRVTPELDERDPDNRLLARGPRVRLSAEAVRDQALFAGGLLSTKMYGPSVRPRQPSMGVSAAFGGGIDWQTSDGEDGYRRALYTMWRRSNPYPSMATFDAPNREVCTVRRVPTNTPLQALVTLNDPVFVEAAQALARRAVSAGGPAAADRARYAFRLCLARPPHDDELARLVRLYERSLARFAQSPAEAKRLATEPLGEAPAEMNLAELAAWTVVGNVLLNLDETLMKR
ncbi:MAG TPA: DUF1553 domain-containing protein [Pirellulales bacterium]|nr:DUF1553 domain-containing protein [Pirellulales bacterium]